MYDRRPLDKVSAFLSELVSCLLSTDPRRRPSAEELLRRIRYERQKVRGRSETQSLMREEADVADDDDDTRGSNNDSAYDTLNKRDAPAPVIQYEIEYERASIDTPGSLVVKIVECRVRMYCTDDV